jgi:hypothetical protein
MKMSSAARARIKRQSELFYGERDKQYAALWESFSEDVRHRLIGWNDGYSQSEDLRASALVEYYGRGTRHILRLFLHLRGFGADQTAIPVVCLEDVPILSDMLRAAAQIPAGMRPKTIRGRVANVDYMVTRQNLRTKTRFTFQCIAFLYTPVIEISVKPNKAEKLQRILNDAAKLAEEAAEKRMQEVNLRMSS